MLIKVVCQVFLLMKRMRLKAGTPLTYVLNVLQTIVVSQVKKPLF